MAEFAEDTTPKVEELDSDDEEVTPQASGASSASSAPKGDKKTRKAMQKMGMKPVPGITRVAMKNTPTIVFAINSPEVYKSTSSNTYIVIGEPKVEDSSGNAQAQQAAAAAQQYSKVQSAAPTAGAKPGAVEDTDETGVSDDDITIVMGQANCTRGQAVAALKNNENDIVNAIMELTL